MNFQKTNPGIILFGDSVFFGIGASKPAFGCGVVLRSMLVNPIIIKAEGREFTRKALGRIEKDVFPEKDHIYVVIQFGNNDCRLINTNTPKISLTEYKENLKKIIQTLLSAKKIPIITNLQPLDNEKAYNSLLSIRKYAIGVKPYDWQKQYSDACEEIASTNKISFIDIRTDLEKEGDTVIANDGLHPNDRGHKIIALTMKRSLNEIL